MSPAWALIVPSTEPSLSPGPVISLVEAVSGPRLGGGVSLGEKLLPFTHSAGQEHFSLSSRINLGKGLKTPFTVQLEVNQLLKVPEPRKWQNWG